MKSQKGFSSLIGIVIIVALAVVAIGSIFAYQYFTMPKENNQLQIQNEQQNQNTENTTDQTAGWKTYRNDEYGFEFKYPTDWILEGNRYLSPKNVAENKNTALPPTYSLSVGYVSSQEIFLKDMREFRLKNNLDNEYGSADYTNLKNCLKSVNGNVAEANIAGKNAIVSVLSTALNEIFIYIESDGGNYVIFTTPEAYSASNPHSMQLLAEKPVILPEVKNIISTFKFTK